MATFFDKLYRVKFRDDLGDPEFWNRRFKDLDARIGANEEVRADLDAVIEEATQTFSTKSDEILIPLIAEVYEAAELGVMFRVTSATEQSVTSGGKTFVIDEGQRLRFAAPAYVSIYRTESPSAAMLATVISYDSGTGELVVDVDRVSGDGTHSNWIITVGAPSDTAEAIAGVLDAETAAKAAQGAAEAARDEALIARDTAESKAMDASASSASASDAASSAAISITTLEAIFANQSQVHLGAAITDPVTDLNGDPLVVGAEYYNTVDGNKKIYDGTGWTVSYVPVGSEVTSIFGRTGNVVATAGDYSAEKISLAAITGMSANQVQAAIEELNTDLGSHDHDSDYYTKSQIDTSLAGKSDTTHSHGFNEITATPVTISGYGITDAYTKTDVDGLLSPLATTSYVDTQISGLLGGAPAAALDTIAELATALTDNDSDIAAITTSLAGKANSVHTHVISEVTGLQATLDAKAGLSHTHAISEITNLQTSLDAKLASSAYSAADVLAKIKTVDGTTSGLDADLLDGIHASGFMQTSWTITAGTGLTGGGTGAANRTLNLNIATQAEAEAGTSSAKAMTPQRTAQAIAALGGGEWEALSDLLTVTNQASLNITGLTSDYMLYRLYLHNVVPASDTVALLLRTSSNGGVSHDSGSSDYAWGRKHYYFGSSAIGGQGTDNASSIDVNNLFGNAANENYSGYVDLLFPAETDYTKVQFWTVGRHYNAGPVEVSGGGMRKSAAAVDAFQLFMSSGNMSLKYRLFGLKAA